METFYQAFILYFCYFSNAFYSMFRFYLSTSQSQDFSNKIWKSYKIMPFSKLWRKQRKKTNINLIKITYINNFVQNKYFPKLLHVCQGDNSADLELKCEREEIHELITMKLAFGKTNNWSLYSKNVKLSFRSSSCERKWGWKTGKNIVKWKISKRIKLVCTKKKKHIGCEKHLAQIASRFYK